MNHSSSCYVPKLDKTGLVLGVLDAARGAWVFPSAPVLGAERLEHAAVRALEEVTGLSAVTALYVYCASDAVDPATMLHVFQIQVRHDAEPAPRAPGMTAAWVTRHQLCDSQAFGSFYQKFFASRDWTPKR